VTKKNAAFWDVTKCGSYKNDVLKNHIDSVIKVKRISELGTTLAVINSGNFFPMLLIPFTLVMKVISTSETSVLTTAT
jgi:hypothetical protein